ncbi:MAG: hypothetical protein J5604_05810 [Bacteroidales bacterium]|nr:hypothetical protein [Bacteroidales bacterium]
MKAVLFYYSQSGQALRAAENICKGFDKTDVVCKEIVPLEHYPFPWSRREFFEVFPETRLGICPSGIAPLNLEDVKDADIVLIAAQSWFLSPSLPLLSFLCDENVKNFLRGREVVFVNVCRNMWLKTSEALKLRFKEIGAYFRGQIILQDASSNYVSAITIVRWLLHGKKKATKILPEAGVKEEELAAAARFGKVIETSLLSGNTATLQQELLKEGAIKYRPSILSLEKTAFPIFGRWAKFIRKKGGYKEPKRQFRVKLFYFYLLFVLFVLSPFAQLFFLLTRPLRKVKSNKLRDCNL